ncbi:hypothetical protein BVI434_2210006 [Burkholderia vietnamiensis]|nr:hypothetical protein BVI434_2210006 [Burkholderia vietnamiensis]
MQRDSRRTSLRAEVLSIWTELPSFLCFPTRRLV